MQQYVVGFLFDARCERVVLMMKRRPEWQRGRWNDFLVDAYQSERLKGPPFSVGKSPSEPTTF